MSQLTVKCPYSFEKNASTTNIHNMNEDMEKRGPQMNFNLFPIQKFVKFSRGATNRVKVFFINEEELLMSSSNYFTSLEIVKQNKRNFSVLL